jgi:hypothetical protein
MIFLDFFFTLSDNHLTPNPSPEGEGNSSLRLRVIALKKNFSQNSARI